MITYKPIEKKISGKKPRIEYIFKSPIGISGGRFQKREMIESMLDNEYIDIRIKTSLLPHKAELLKMTSIPKPIDDLVDAVLLVYTEILKPIYAHYVNIDKHKKKK